MSALSPELNSGNELQVRIQQKIDTKSNWEANNPKLLKGEIAVVDFGNNIYREKIGDGQKFFNALPYATQEKNLNKAITLNVSDWTVTSSEISAVKSLAGGFFNKNGYSYMVSPQSNNSVDSYDEYVECGVRAKSVDNGSIKFVCKQKPSKTVVVEICRIEVDE